MFGRTTKKHQRKHVKGFSLLEVVIAAGVLATAIMGSISFYITSDRFSLLAREDSIALYAAEEVINEIRDTNFSTTVGDKIVADYHHETRPINLYGPQGTQQRLSVQDIEAEDDPNSTLIPADNYIKVTDELGIVIVNEESPVESNFGDVDTDGDIDFPIDLDGNGNYFDTLSTEGTVATFPMNLGGDSTLANETIAVELLKLYPVIVIVQWHSMARLNRRIQVLTFITDRSGRF